MYICCPIYDKTEIKWSQLLNAILYIFKLLSGFWFTACIYPDVRTSSIYDFYVINSTNQVAYTAPDVNYGGEGFGLA